MMWSLGKKGKKLSVTANVALSSGLFVPYHTRVRGGEDGKDPVGTVQVDGEATGDGSAGTVAVNIRMVREQFGFACMWVPTYIEIGTTENAVNVCEFRYRQEGNARLSGDMVEIVTTVAAFTQDGALLQLRGMPLEGVGVALVDVLRITFPSNTNTDFYHLHAFGPIYDLEVIRRKGGIAELIAGVT